MTHIQKGAFYVHILKTWSKAPLKSQGLLRGKDWAFSCQKMHTCKSAYTQGAWNRHEGERGRGKMPSDMWFSAHSESRQKSSTAQKTSMLTDWGGITFKCLFLQDSTLLIFKDRFYTMPKIVTCSTFNRVVSHFQESTISITTYKDRWHPHLPPLFLPPTPRRKKLYSISSPHPR